MISSNLKSFSVVICTLDNKKILKYCLESIKYQTLFPKEIIIVYGGEKKDIEDYINTLNLTFPTELIYTKARKSLVFQRNQGIKLSNGDVIFFIDDDAVLDKSYFKNIMEYYQENWTSNLGGVQGTIWEHKNIKVTLSSYLRKLFLNSIINGNGRLQISGYPSFISYYKSPIEVEVFNGCMMSFKREVFNENNFNSTFEKYWWGDDIEFSYRISKNYKLVQIPNAILHHKSSTPSYEGSEKIWYMTCRNRKIIFQKYFSSKKVNYIFYYWSIIGDFIIGISQSIKTKSLNPVIGIIKGLNSKKVFVK